VASCCCEEFSDIQPGEDNSLVWCPDERVVFSRRSSRAAKGPEMTKSNSHIRSLLSDRARTSLSTYLTSKSIRVARTSQFVFLCGKSLDEPGCARKTLLDYGRRHITWCKFFLAEDAIAALQESGATPDLLTIEGYLADYADSILIILESDGAKAELGAFAHRDDLSRKTLVINDERFRDSPSFIREGPIRKLDKESKLGETIYTSFASISRVHDLVAERLRLVQPKQRSLLRFDDYKSLRENVRLKDRTLLIADLVGLLSPIAYRELIDILEMALGDGEYDFLQVDRSMLRSLGFLREDIEIGTEKMLVTTPLTSPFCEYDRGDLFEIRSQILLSYRKRDRQRFDLLRERAGEK